MKFTEEEIHELEILAHLEEKDFDHNTCDNSFIYLVMNSGKKAFEIIEKQQKEIEYKNKYIEDIENQHKLELIGKEEYTKAVMSEIIEDYYVPIEEYEKIREELYNSIPKDTIKEKMGKLLIIIKKYNKQMKNGKETDISYDELRKYACELEVYRKLLEGD